MAAGAKQPPVAFDPAAFQSFRFLARDLDGSGVVTMRYALDQLEFTERIALPLPTSFEPELRASVEGLLSLLHWVAGVSYFKAALPPAISCESGTPAPAVATLLEALYSEGLGELAYVNGLESLPRPRFPRTEHGPGAGPAPASEPRRVLVPVGGGKDSVVAIEAVRRSGVELELFSLGDPPPIARTAEISGLPRLIARRELDPLLFDLNAGGAINGHVPITAIVTCVALLVAALHGFDSVALANERS